MNLKELKEVDLKVKESRNEEKTNLLVRLGHQRAKILKLVEAEILVNWYLAFWLVNIYLPIMP